MFLNNNSASPAVQSPVQCQQGPPPAVNTNASLAHPSLPLPGHAATLSKRVHTLAGHRGAPGEAATPRSGARCEDAAERSSSASPPEAGGVPATVGAAEAQAPSSSSDNVKVLVRSCLHAMTSSSSTQAPFYIQDMVLALDWLRMAAVRLEGHTLHTVPH